MKKSIFLLTGLFVLLSAAAQKKDFTYKFYGFVRGDLFYNSRANVAAVDGTFYLYPLDIERDANGKDLNATPNGSFYTFTTRLGLDVTGPKVGTARTSAKIETDFGGFGSNITMLRIRQAYVALDWDRQQLLIGQTWHPLFGTVFPDMLNLSTGTPFNPFNRSPMLRYQYYTSKVRFTGATIWQLQYMSQGPNGGSQDYLKNSCIPEIYVGADFTPISNFLIGAGAYLISLKPRTRSTWNGNIYKVNERMTAISYEAHAKYTSGNFTFSAKSILSSAMDNSLLLGGYAVTDIDSKTGEQEYTPFRYSTSWVNFTYGSKWKAGLFGGFSKSLGTGEELINPIISYGRNPDIGKLITINPNFTYNLPHWRLGVEYSWAQAHYGTINASDGKVKDMHSVTNHRILALLVYSF